MNKYTQADNNNVCNCPIDSIEYLITVENTEAIDVKTGRCLRCLGVRLSKKGELLASKSIKKASQKAKAGLKKKSNTNMGDYL